jgi:hypothetical protein
MKELNLEVGQKVWTIQLGYCEVYMIDKESTFPIRCRNIYGKSATYTINGKSRFNDSFPCLFESNPFYRFVETNETIELSHQENKAELINAYCFVLATNTTSIESKNIAQNKLKNLLETL